MGELTPGQPTIPTISQLAQAGQKTARSAPADAQRGYAAAARKASSTLRVSASIVAALAVSPGVDADEAELASATAQIVDRAGQLTDAAMRLAAQLSDAAAIPGYKALFRQHAVEFASDEWQEAHAEGREQIDIQKVIALYEKVIASKLFSGEEEATLSLQGLDVVTAKRFALISAIPAVYKAIVSFDYFVPDSFELLERATATVVNAAERGRQRLVNEAHSQELQAVMMQSLISEMGALYASNYRAQARKEVRSLCEMEVDARLRHMVTHRHAGLPTEQVFATFDRLAERVVTMVCDAVPELSARPAQSTSPAAAQQPHSPQP